jgi:hypothetical protein
MALDGRFKGHAPRNVGGCHAIRPAHSIHRPGAIISQGQVSGSAEKSVVSGSSMPLFIPDIGDVSQTCPLEHRPTNAATRGLAPA